MTPGDDPVDLLPHRPPFRFVDAGAVALLSDERYAGSLPLFGGVEDVRWRRLVRPGDELVLEVVMDRLSARGGWGEGTATVSGKAACKARLFFILGTAEGSNGAR